MRYLLLTAAILPLPVLADSFETPSRVSAVTLYPWGASVTRVAELTLPPGSHEVTLPDLPGTTDAASLRVVPSEGLVTGAVNLQTGRLAVDAPKTPARQAAEDEVTRAQDALADAQAAIDAVLVRVQAADEQIAFLRGLAKAGGGDDPIALSQRVRTEVQAALQTAQAAKAEARTLEPARREAETRLARAEQALAALSDDSAPRAMLTLTVDSTGGPAQIKVTSFTPDAGWQPAYDAYLTHATGAPALRLDRGAVINQASGEDWIGVDLTLSTARPTDQSAPSTLSPWLRHIWSPKDMAPMAKRGGGLMARADYAAEAMAAAEPGFADQADLAMQGATVTWHYGNAVDIRDGVEALQLKLGEVRLTPDILAEVVPLADDRAYLVAETHNSAGQVILPGPANLWLDGAMVGQQTLPLTADGDEMRLGFGPIDGLIAERIIPARSEGEKGLLSRSNQQVEEATIRVKNLTGRDWPLRILDRVPYSEQDALKISYAADPVADVTDYDEKRGLLAWEAPLNSGETREIHLTTTLSWPEGQVLD